MRSPSTAHPFPTRPHAPPRAAPRLLLLASVFVLCFPARGFASYHEWIGTDPISSNWDLVLNWQLVFGVPPNNGTGEIYFVESDFPPIPRPNPFVNTPWSVYSLTFESPYSHVLSGSTLTIGAGGITKNSPLATGINNNLVLGADQQWHVSWSPLTVNGDIACGAHDLTLDASSNVGLTGVLSGTGHLYKEGDGILTLTGANTYSGGTRIDDGTVFAGANNVIPAGTLEFRGGTLDLTGHSETVGPGAVAATGILFTPWGDLNDPCRIVIGTQLAISTLGRFIERSAGYANEEILITGGPLTLGTSSGTRVIHVMLPDAGDAGVTIESAVINPGGTVGTAPAIQKTGSGRLTLTGVNTFPRRVQVAGGQLRIRDGDALGTWAGGSNDGTEVLAGGRLELSGAIAIIDESLALTGDGGVGIPGALHIMDGIYQWQGPINLPGSASIGVAASSELFVGGVVSGAGGSLTKRGPGKLVLVNANTYLGPTTVLEGTLRVVNSSATGAGDVVVGSGATLEGIGAIPGLATIQSGGRLEPTWHLGFGGLTLEPLATTAMEIGGLLAGTNYDQITVTNPVTLGGTLAVTLSGGFVPSLGDEFVLMTYPSRSGTFTNVVLPNLPSGLYWNLDHGPTTLRAIVTNTVDVEDTPPARHALHAPVPNPWRQSTALRFDIAEPAIVSLYAYDIAGRQVARVVAPAWRTPGRYTEPWDGLDGSGRPLPAGSYFVRLLVNGRPVGEARTIQRLR